MSLTRLRRIAYSRPRFDGNGRARKKTHDVIVTYKALVQITKAYKGLTTREAKKVMAGAELTSRATRLLIEVSPLLLDQIDTFHLLKPIGLHDEIERRLGTALQFGYPAFHQLSSYQESRYRQSEG